MNRRTFLKGLLVGATAALAGIHKALAFRPPAAEGPHRIRRIWFDGRLVYEDGWIDGIDRFVRLHENDPNLLVARDLPLFNFRNQIPRVDFCTYAEPERQFASWISVDRSHPKVLELEGLDNPLPDWRTGSFLARLEKWPA